MHRNLFLIQAALLVLALLSDSWPVSAQDNLLLYVAEVGGNRDIYTMRPDGTGITRLTMHPAEDTDPTWSPDRQWIAFTSNRDGDGFAIYIMRADGSNVRRLSPPTVGAFVYRSAPNWSPDGQNIVFVMEEMGSSRLYTISVNGGNERSLSDHAGAESPAWSPNGELAYAAPGPRGNMEIFLRDRSGNSILLTDNSSASHSLPTWSPDGAQLAYVSSERGLNEIYVMNLASRQSRFLASSDNLLILSLAWSPDGAEIAYTNLRGMLVVIAADGYATRVLRDELTPVRQVSWASYRGVGITQATETTDSVASITNRPAGIEGVITTGRLNVRRNPSTNAMILSRVSQGDIVEVIGRNADSSWIVVDTGIVGWVRASYVNVLGDVLTLPVYGYNALLPASQRQATLVHCAGARGPSFQTNDRFIVPFGDRPTNVFREPNRRPLVTRIPEGRGGVILAGPICVRGQRGNLVIWYVRTDNGFEGYVSEGYQTDPVPWIVPQR